MHGTISLWVKALVALVAVITIAEAAPYNSTNSECRYLPGDAGWPSNHAWAQLNNTVGGRLIRGVPFGQPCYGTSADAAACAKAQDTWEDLSPL